MDKHRVWDIATIEEFKNELLENVALKKEVPEVIKEQLSVVEKLMIHCFYEYDFIDVAMLQAIIILEKALKIRYEELGNVLTKKTSFEDLIDWALEKKLFEDPNPDIYHGLRKLRNNKVHNLTGKGGLLYLKGVYRIFDYINDLYEDVGIRKLRHQQTKAIYDSLNVFCRNGFIISYSNKRLIGFKAIPSFLNNKSTVNELTLNISTIFDPNCISFKKGRPNNSIVLTVTDWDISEKFTAKIKNGEILTFEPITDSVNQNKFKNWEKDCNIYGNFSILYFSAEEKQGYLNELRKFHTLE